jgi:hypothetical protein
MLAKAPRYVAAGRSGIIVSAVRWDESYPKVASLLTQERERISGQGLWARELVCMLWEIA